CRSVRSSPSRYTVPVRGTPPLVNRTGKVVISVIERHSSPPGHVPGYGHDRDTAAPVRGGSNLAVFDAAKSGRRTAGRPGGGGTAAGNAPRCCSPPGTPPPTRCPE